MMARLFESFLSADPFPSQPRRPIGQRDRGEAETGTGPGLGHGETRYHLGEREVCRGGEELVGMIGRRWGRVRMI